MDFAPSPLKRKAQSFEDDGAHYLPLFRPKKMCLARDCDPRASRSLTESYKSHSQSSSLITSWEPIAGALPEIDETFTTPESPVCSIQFSSGENDSSFESQATTPDGDFTHGTTPEGLTPIDSPRVLSSPLSQHFTDLGLSFPPEERPGLIEGRAELSEKETEQASEYLYPPLDEAVSPLNLGPAALQGADGEGDDKIAAGTNGTREPKRPLSLVTGEGHDEDDELGQELEAFFEEEARRQKARMSEIVMNLTEADDDDYFADSED